MELLEIISSLEAKLNFHQVVISDIEKNVFLMNHKNIEYQVQTDIENYLNNGLSYKDIIIKGKWGDIVNFDLLASFLSTIIFIKVPYGSYENNALEKEKVLDYFEYREEELYNIFYNYTYINYFLNKFITFVKQNYDFNFFNHPDFLDQENIVKVYLKIENITKDISGIGNFYYSKNLKTADEVVNYLNNQRLEKEDLLSELIDTSYFNETCILIYNWYLDFIIKFLYLVKVMKPKRNVSNMEIQIYRQFASDLKEYIQNRIVKLESQKSKKLIK